MTATDDQNNKLKQEAEAKALAEANAVANQASAPPPLNPLDKLVAKNDDKKEEIKQAPSPRPSKQSKPEEEDKQGKKDPMTLFAEESLEFAKDMKSIVKEVGANLVGMAKDKAGEMIEQRRALAAPTPSSSVSQNQTAVASALNNVQPTVTQTPQAKEPVSQDLNQSSINNKAP